MKGVGPALPLLPATHFSSPGVRVRVKGRGRGRVRVRVRLRVRVSFPTRTDSASAPAVCSICVVSHRESVASVQCASGCAPGEGEGWG